MRIALKEWAVVVDALGRGDQIILLRKGGLRDEQQSFHVEHEEFFLFPTQFHQQRESVIPSAQQRFDQLARSTQDASRMRLEFFARVAESRRLDSLSKAERLRGQHIWCDEVIANRFDWGRERSIHALAVRVFRLSQPVNLPMLPSYAGCKSWIEMVEDVATTGAGPVLSERDFELKLAAFRNALPPPKQPLSRFAAANPAS